MIETIISYCERFPAVLVRLGFFCLRNMACTHMPYIITTCYIIHDSTHIYIYIYSWIQPLPVGLGFEWENGRQWKYNSKIAEYFVETETTTKLKQKELETIRETTTTDSWWCIAVCCGVYIVKCWYTTWTTSRAYASCQNMRCNHVYLFFEYIYICIYN